MPNKEISPFCLRCGRPLKLRQSQEDNYGNWCYIKKFGKRAAKKREKKLEQKKKTKKGLKQLWIPKTEKGNKSTA